MQVSATRKLNRLYPTSDSLANFCRRPTSLASVRCNANPFGSVVHKKCGRKNM